MFVLMSKLIDPSKKKRLGQKPIINTYGIFWAITNMVCISQVSRNQEATRKTNERWKEYFFEIVFNEAA